MTYFFAVLIFVQLILAPQAMAATEKYAMAKKPAAVIQPVPKTSQMMVKKNFDLGPVDPNLGPAKIQMIYPTAGMIVKGTFDIKVDAKGGGGAKQVKIDSNDGSGWKSVGSSNNPQGTVFTIPWNSLVVKDGDVNFAVGADHKDGSTSFVNIKVTVQNVVDKAPPVVTFHNVMQNMDMSGSYKIYVIATDDVGVTQVDIFADGKPLKPVTTGKPDAYYVTWDTTTSADGPVTLTADAYDKVGNKTTSTAAVKVTNHADKTPPTVKILSPTFNQSFDLGNIPISADVQDNDAIDHVEFYGEQNAFLGSKGDVPYEWTWDTNATGAQQGPASIRVVAFDKAGNSAEAKQSIVLVNPKFHSVKITPNPADGANVHGKFTVTADCNPPDNVDHVNFSYGGQPSVPVKGANPYEFNWDLSGKPDGDIELLMVAVDKNDGYLGEIQVTYHIQNVKDATPPKMKIISPSNGDVLSGPVTLEVEATDDIAMDWVNMGNGANLFEQVKGAGPAYKTVWDTTKGKDGPFTLSFTAVDTSHNLTDLQINVKVENDAMAPLCEITSPQDGDEVKDNVTVKVSASDDKGLENVQIYPNYQLGVFPGQSFQQAPFELTFDSKQLDDGTIPIVAVAVDKAGHETKAQIKVKVLNNPWHQITFKLNPPEGSMVKGAVNLGVTCMPDDSKVDYVEFGGGGQKIKGGNPFEYEWNTTMLSNGQQGMTISAFDKNGMQLGAQSYSWDVEN